MTVAKAPDVADVRFRAPDLERMCTFPTEPGPAAFAAFGVRMFALADLAGGRA